MGLLPSLSRPQFLHLQSGRLLEADTELICKESYAQCPVPMTLKRCQLSSLQSRRAVLQPSLGFLSPSHSNRSGRRPETPVTSHTHLGEFHQLCSPELICVLPPILVPISEPPAPPPPAHALSPLLWPLCPISPPRSRSSPGPVPVLSRSRGCFKCRSKAYPRLWARTPPYR